MFNVKQMFYYEMKVNRKHEIIVMLFYLPLTRLHLRTLLNMCPVPSGKSRSKTSHQKSDKFESQCNKCPIVIQKFIHGIVMLNNFIL